MIPTAGFSRLAARSAAWVDDVGEIGAGEPGRPRRDRAELDGRVEANAARVHLEDGVAALEIGTIVAAMMITPREGSKPSISRRSWLTVCSRS